MKRKISKQGFTLMELLAVIVILSIILLITTPIIFNIIKDVKKGAFESGIKNIVRIVENEQLNNQINGFNKTLEYEYKDGKIIGSNDLNYRGQKPDSGKIIITKDGKVSLVLYSGEYCAIKKYEEDKIMISESTEEFCLTGNDDMSEENPVKEIVGFNEEKGVNHPVLTTGMTPIIWDGIEWIEVQPNNPVWYDYNNKKWANAKTDDGSFWVWIPRYAYKITSGYHTNVAGSIDIKFLKEKTTETVDNSPVEASGYEAGIKDTSMHYFLHPAFQFGDEEALGFWVAKFEPTASEGVSSSSSTCNALDNVTTKTVKIIPNVTSWRCIDAGNAFTVSLNMKEKENIYGWTSSEVDTHMMKNNEWGAIAYLSKSNYGKVSEVTINANANYLVGNGDYLNNVNQSTTGNIYGIYDMNGGSTERIAAYLEGGKETNIEAIVNADTKYKDVYLVGTTNTAINNYNKNTNIYGDAMWETSSSASGANSWYQDASGMAIEINPLIVRGGNRTNGVNAGLFAFNLSDGFNGAGATFRPTLFIK